MAGGGISETGTYYSRTVGLVYVFNLIVGTGALTMPSAFHTAGWLLSLITIIILSFMSFLTVTFVTETMSISNALLKTADQSRKASKHSINADDAAITDEQRPLLNPNTNKVVNEEEPAQNIFEITERTELGHMASMFFNKVGLLVFNLCIVIYLYGDLSIYAAAVPKSIRDIACTYKLNVTMEEDDICWKGHSLTRINFYRICVVGFFLLLGGFTFFNVQKTKYLQIATTLSRWIAFGMMIILALMRLSRKEGEGHPSVADISGVPNLFGVCVYSFMCHHSLPSLITPIRNKSRLYALLGGDYVIILLFYALISFTGIYAFQEVQDIYTLNFLPDENGNQHPITNVAFIQYFLALFPVFTLSTNFPIISITLRNNLKAIWYNESRPYTWIVDRVFFPLLALIPPMGVAVATNQVEFLVGITGSYAGAGIQYVIPAMLVYCGRKQTDLLFEERNIHASPFRNKWWIVFVCVWAALCMGFVTVNHIVTRK